MQKSPQVAGHVVKGEKRACSILKVWEGKPVLFVAKTRDFARICEGIKEKGLAQTQINAFELASFGLSAETILR